MQKKTEEEEPVNKVSGVAIDYFSMSEEDWKANKNSILVIKDENSRATVHEGAGTHRKIDWRVKDMSAELKALEHPGGGENALITKSARERCRSWR